MATKKREGSDRAAAPFITGGDWSVGLNSPSSISHAELLSALGEKLRASYDDLVGEAVPPHLSPLIEELERKTRRG